LERQESKEGRNDKGTVYRMWKKRYYRRKILCLECRTGNKKP